MGAPDILNVLHDMGLRLSAHGTELHVGPRTAITDDARRLIRDHKVELLAALQRSGDFGTARRNTYVEEEGNRIQPSDADQGDAPPDPAAEGRRRRVLAMLAEQPDKQRAVYCDGVPANGVITICVGIRFAGGIATAEIEVLADRYDGIALLNLVERRSGTLH